MTNRAFVSRLLQPGAVMVYDVRLHLDRTDVGTFISKRCNETGLNDADRTPDHRDVDRSEPRQANTFETKTTSSRILFLASSGRRKSTVCFLDLLRDRGSVESSPDIADHGHTDPGNGQPLNPRRCNRVSARPPRSLSGKPRQPRRWGTRTTNNSQRYVRLLRRPTYLPLDGGVRSAQTNVRRRRRSQVRGNDVHHPRADPWFR